MGQKITPLYRARNETIIDHIGITEGEQRQLLDYFGKPILCNKQVVREYDTARKEKARRAAGAMTREDYEAQAKEHQEKAQVLRQQGLSYRKIAEKLKCSTMEAHRLINRGCT